MVNLSLCLTVAAAVTASVASVGTAQNLPQWCFNDAPISQCPRIAKPSASAPSCANGTTIVPVSADGLKLAATIDSLGVQDKWRKGGLVDWVTGDPVSQGNNPYFTPPVGPHSGAYVAAVAHRAGIYLLRPPAHTQRMLYKQQLSWLENSPEARRAGWRLLRPGADSAVRAQNHANAGNLVLATFEDLYGYGHISVVYPSSSVCSNDVNTNGPQVSFAGPCNFHDVSANTALTCHNIATWTDAKPKYFVYNVARRKLSGALNGVWSIYDNYRPYNNSQRSVSLISQQRLKGDTILALLFSSARYGNSWIFTSSGMSNDLRLELDWHKYTYLPGRPRPISQPIRGLGLHRLDSVRGSIQDNEVGEAIGAITVDGHVDRVQLRRIVPLLTDKSVRGFWFASADETRSAFALYIVRVSGRGVSGVLLGYRKTGKPTWSLFRGNWTDASSGVARGSLYDKLFPCRGPNACDEPYMSNVELQVGQQNTAASIKDVTLRGGSGGDSWAITFKRSTSTPGAINFSSWANRTTAATTPTTTAAPTSTAVPTTATAAPTTATAAPTTATAAPTTATVAPSTSAVPVTTTTVPTTTTLTPTNSSATPTPSSTAPLATTTLPTTTAANQTTTGPATTAAPTNATATPVTTAPGTTPVASNSTAATPAATTAPTNSSAIPSTTPAPDTPTSITTAPTTIPGTPSVGATTQPVAGTTSPPVAGTTPAATVSATPSTTRP